jgi:folate-binding protein YgfZ
MDNLTSLDQFGFVAVTGRDAQKFLQGYTTCDLDELPASKVSAGAICNIKGRMVCNFLLCREEDGFLLRIHRDLIEPVIAFLGKYIVFSKASLVDRTDTLHCYGLTAEGGKFPHATGAITATSNGHLVKVSEAPRFELWTTELQETGGDPMQWLQSELREGIVWVDESSAEEYIPQMFNLQSLEGISFSKGCYLGQEIVARMQYRGELKNRLHIGESESPLSNGTKILNPKGRPAGTIVGAAGLHFAAVLRAGETGYSLEDGTPVTVAEVLKI